MAFTTDLQTDIGKVRLMLFDLNSANAIFPDDTQIQAFLDLEGGDVKNGAALALESLAGNRIYTMKVGQILDLKIDGASVGKALLDTAKRLREFPGDGWGGFEIAEIVDNDVFAWQEKYWKLVLRESA